jgi:hypothetical protein
MQRVSHFHANPNSDLSILGPNAALKVIRSDPCIANGLPTKFGAEVAQPLSYNALMSTGTNRPGWQRPTASILMQEQN